MLISNLCNAVPMEATYAIYQMIGVPHSVRDFLTKICIRRDQEDKIPEINEYFGKTDLKMSFILVR